MKAVEKGSVLSLASRSFDRLLQADRVLLSAEQKKA